MVEVSKNSQGKWLYWCPACYDGYQGGKRAASNWWLKHEVSEHHKWKVASYAKEDAGNPGTDSEG